MFHKGRKVKKSKKKKIISLIVVVAVAGTSGAVVYRKVRRPVAAATEVSKVQTAEVKKENISNTITGTGNLELDDAEAVSIPSGLTIGDVLVESGDYVSAETVLANVDSASVQTAMDEIQSELEELDEKIRTCQEDEDANAVVSSVSGRVKAIYVEEGSDVADIITEKGTLIELSLDGYMAVSIEKTDSVAAGDSVSVTLSDGTVVTGTVDTQESGSTIITVTDNGTTLGDEVSVSDSNGNVLGSGTLYIHQPFEVTAAGGTVSSVSVTENESVSADDELLVLEGTESSAEYEKIVQTAGRNALGEFAPEFAHFNDDVLFGENWNNQDIDVKTRSIITVVALMASGITDSSLKYHLQNAKNHGVTQKEIAAVITHVAFYAGWPKAWAVFNLAKEVWEAGEGDLPYEEEAMRAHAKEMVFPIGAPNDGFAQYFSGRSFLAPISTSQVGIFNVTFEPGCSKLDYVA